MKTGGNRQAGDPAGRMVLYMAEFDSLLSLFNGPLLRVDQVVKERDDAGDRHGEQDVGAEVRGRREHLHAGGGQIGRPRRSRQMLIQIFDVEVLPVRVPGEPQDFGVEVLVILGSCVNFYPPFSDFV